MNLHQFRFVQEAVRRTLNLTETAKALHTSQPGISKAILELEEELGVDIFARHGKRIRRVTEPGRLVLQSVEIIMREVANLRRIGDDTTRLDRYEPELNEATPGDPRDTSTPRAMAETLKRLLLDGALKPDARDQLEAWMAGNAVAGGLLRAKLPTGWTIADRGGAGGHGTRGVIALLRPPEGAPLVVAIYMDGRQHTLKTRDAAIAEIGAAIFAEYDR
mgnify:CR=1 FL=1